MSFRISLRLLLKALFEFFCKIYPRLIGKTDENPENVCHFLAEVRLFALFEALVAVCSGDDLSLIHISEPTRQESLSRMPSSA